jgi:hypothetical protein
MLNPFKKNWLRLTQHINMVYYKCKEIRAASCTVVYCIIVNIRQDAALGPLPIGMIDIDPSDVINE